MSTANDQHDAIARIESIIREIEALPDARARGAAQALTHALLELHRLGLREILSFLQSADDAASLLEGLAASDVVSSLLLLHDLHPVPFETRVHRAIDAARGELAAHGGALEVVRVGENVVRLRVSGGPIGRGLPSTLVRALEQAIRDAAPDAEEVSVELEVPSQLLPVEQLLSGGRRNPESRGSSTP